MKLHSSIFAIGILLSAAACNTQKSQPTSRNPHAFVTDESHAAMITSLKVIDPGRLLEMDFTADYKLDRLIDSNVESFESFMDFVSQEVFDVKAQNYDNQSLSVGCSAFAATEAGTGNYLMGRNYDYCHVENGEEIPLTAILVRTSPEGGKKSISMVDSYWMGLHKGFYDDGKTDLSMLMAAPYMMVDGINEDGFAVGALHLDGNGTWQNEAGKKSLWMFVLMRKLLDSAATVEDAVRIASEYNVILTIPTASGSLHFYVADAGGDFAILEYSYAEGEDTATAHPNTLKVLRGQDCYRYVTNFYADPALSEHPTLGPLGKHGLARYETLKNAIDSSDHTLSSEDAMGLLKSVSQNSNPDENTSHTQWSSLYNLSEKKLDISILQEYGTKYTFFVEDRPTDALR